MSAYNWITIDVRCPQCADRARIRCQTHVASDYAGDHSGRFHDRDYTLGEPMAWWPPDHPQFESWRKHGDAVVDEEACYSSCSACKADLCVVIRFRDLIPEAVISISPEADWPEGYSR